MLCLSCLAIRPVAPYAGLVAHPHDLLAVLVHGRTTTYAGVATTLEAKGRHDPCVLPRTPPLVEAMAALV
jgi:chorismate synthase